MVFNIELAGTYLSFHNFAEDSFLDTWEWKLDPWKVPDSSNESHKLSTISITRATTHSIEAEPLSLFCSEKTGFFERRVYCLPVGESQWDFVRVRGEELLLRYRVDTTWNSITLLQDNTKTQGTVAFEYLAQMMPGVCLRKGILTLHCALVEYDGMAFAVCATSGTGKTTHARLWRDYKNALILNGDRALCRRTKKGWIAYGSPWSGTSGEQINRQAPLKALVILERAKNNSIFRLKNIDIFPNIFPHVLYPSWDREMTELAMDQLEDLLQSVPVYLLKCRPDVGAVETMYRAIWEKEIYRR